MKSADRSRGLLIGVNPVREQLRRDAGAIRQIMVAHGVGAGAAELAGEAKRAGVEVVRETPHRLRELAGSVSHQGVVALVRPYRYHDWYDLLAHRPGCLLVGDQITDPRNLGALIRSAEAAGVGGMVVPRDRSAAVSAVVAKAAAGATSSLPVACVVNLARALGELKDVGYWVVGLDGGAPQSLFDFTFPSLCAIVVGAEGRGVRPLIRSKCDHLLSIPMLGQVGSLNVSVAAAVALYERVRQRQEGGVSSD
jgi:23S rRNA (guanosine2251-2'-O)-methyltransferase